MKKLFAERMDIVHKSFIREILKVTEKADIISFAGGLPDPDLFPVIQIAEAAKKVFENDGRSALQYSTTEGYLPLREYIVARYSKKYGLNVNPENILILNGSQQGLDLIGKTFLNKGDSIVIESPGYLGAIQAFMMYEVQFKPIPLNDDGIDIDLFEKTLSEEKIKLVYTVPTFQNPSGLTYSREKRKEVAKILEDNNVIFVEDAPYNDLRFAGEDLPFIKSSNEDNSIILGSFSKVVSPGLRIGWICANKEILEKITVAKQASDLHSNFLAQRIVYQFLIDNDLDEHLQRIKEAYKKRRDLMVSMIAEYFPSNIKYTAPEGGMFLWVTLPGNFSSLEMFDLAIKENVAFVPGDPFYVNGGRSNSFRLNFSNSDEEKIEEGIKRLAKILKDPVGKYAE